MIQWVVESLDMPWAQHIFVVRAEEMERYHLREVCAQLTPQVRVVPLTSPTRGAAETVLLGLQEAPLQEPLLIANCDQWLAWDSRRFLRATASYDGLIPVFASAHPKWSYVRLDDRSRVVEVAEKRPISPWATCGLYYWKMARAFVDAAQVYMSDEAHRVNGEWYVAPIYNELIAQGGVVLPYTEVQMWGLGTPEDLEEFKLKVCR